MLPDPPTSTKLRYTYKTTPFSHQKRALKKLVELEGKGALFMEMGTGKTKVAVDFAGIGFYNWGIRKVLVVAPKSVLGVWPRQIRQHSGAPVRIFRAAGSTANRVHLFRSLRKAPKDDVLTYAIINYESIWRTTARGANLRDLITMWEPDLVVFDESHRLKSPTSKQSKAAHVIGNSAERRLLLTGTAISKSPLDVFGQFRAMDDTILGTNWYQFRNRFGIWGGFNKYQLKGYRRIGLLTKLIRSHSFRVKKADCLDLPPKLFETVPVTLPDSIVPMYRKMAKDMIIEIEETHATAAIVLVMLLRLSQITSGFIKDVDGVERDLHTAKLDTCMDLIQDLLEDDHKVIIFARFRHDLRKLGEKLTAAKIGHRILSGSVPDTQRDSIVEDFQTDPDVKVFVSQIATGSLGIDLTAGDSVVFYSWDHNAVHYWQAQDRAHRIGQTKSVTYYHLEVPKSIDTIMLRDLKAKENVAETILHKPQILLEF